MNIAVPVKLVPDLVEELSIDPSGTALDTAWLRMIVNEFDDHAIEQAIILKEKTGAHVTVISTDVEGVDDLLFTAAAKGADRLIKLTGDLEGGINNHALARALANIIRDLKPDLILTGVQAHNDLDGTIGPQLAEYLGMPYIGYISGVNIDGDKAEVRKEYPGGLIGEMQVSLPALLGIQASEQPPRYVAISKVRQMMKTMSIEEMALPALDSSGAPNVNRMFQPEPLEKATMLSDNPDEAASQLIDIFKEMGLM
ncbi:MAG: electron transfer flavoprotein subunit beta/FixA family protein [Anaerolineales bacterium]